ncbi:MAG: DNA-3-methyladenine glycosylase family protein [Gaiellaceae bacterium]
MAFVPVPAPYSFERSTERFRAFGPDLANLWHEGGLRRVFDGREVRIEATPGGILVEPEADVSWLLGLHWDIPAFTEFAAGDPVLAEVVRRVEGFRPPLQPDPFEALVTSITAQQVSLFSAFAIRNRLIERFGERATHAYAFPTEERIAGGTEQELVELGFSGRKAEYVVALARAGLDYPALAALPDDEVKARLTALRGLGEWTADWYLARHLARPEAWPAGDLGVRKAVAAFYGEVDIRAVADRFAPFQNLTINYLLLAHRTP